MKIQLFIKDEKNNQQEFVFFSILDAIKEANTLNRPCIIVEEDSVIFTKEIDKDIKVSMSKLHCYDITILQGWIKVKMGFEFNEDSYFELYEESYSNSEILEGLGFETQKGYVLSSWQDEEYETEMDEMELERDEVIEFMKLKGHKYFEL